MEIFTDHFEFSDLNSATQLLKQSRSAFLQLFDNSPICQSITTIDRVYTRVNKKFLETFGFTEEEIIGKNSMQVGILDPGEMQRVGELIKMKGGLQNDYVKCMDKNRNIIHTVSSIEKMEINGKLFLVSFFLDITKIIQQQEAIEQNLRQLESLNKELEAFSYSVSHDLRAPLRAISGYAKILTEDHNDSLDGEGKKVLATIGQSVVRMEKLIEGLLTFSRLGKKAVQKSEIRVEIMLGEIFSELLSFSGSKPEIHTGKLLPLVGDAQLIRQVFINLISNAIKYSSKNPKPKVEIFSEELDDHVVYTVTDNGTGFDMKYADKLFGVFQRLHSEEEFEGTGVGLAIVQKIISRHGGKVSAKAELGKGASFSFALPKRP